MATPAQIQANRLNALKSTGPRSVEGKAVSCFNALKSGIDAKSLVIRGEDPAELETLAANYQLQFQPASPTEQFYVDLLTSTDWKLRRLRKVEAQLWDPQFADPDSPINRHLHRLYSHIASAERVYFRALKELQRLADRASVGQALSPANPNDPEIGFVPSPDEKPQPLAAAVLVSRPPAPEQAAISPVHRPKNENLALRL